jgi:uncharacterized protein (TIGR04255 family)
MIFDNYDKIVCSKSTIHEAWALVYGSPYILQDPDISQSNAAFAIGRKTYTELKLDPVVVTLQKSEGNIQPLWLNQLSWNKSSKIVRVGPRYLSYHRLTDPNSDSNRYNSFDYDIAPYLQSWLEIYRDSFSGSAQDHKVEAVIFGYLNRFKFNIETGFSLGKHFNFDLTMNANLEPNTVALRSFSSSVNFIETDNNTVGDVNLSLALSGEMISDKMVQIDTNAQIGINLKNDISFADIKEVTALVKRAQKRAKQLFFNFITEETFLTEMGGNKNGK